MKLLCSGGEDKHFLGGGLGGSLMTAKFFPGWNGISKFLASGWRLTSIPLVRKTLQFLSHFSQNSKAFYLSIHPTDVFFNLHVLE